MRLSNRLPLRTVQNGSPLQGHVADKSGPGNGYGIVLRESNGSFSTLVYALDNERNRVEVDFVPARFTSATLVEVHQPHKQSLTNLRMTLANRELNARSNAVTANSAAP